MRWNFIFCLILWACFSSGFSWADGLGLTYQLPSCKGRLDFPELHQLWRQEYTLMRLMKNNSELASSVIAGIGTGDGFFIDRLDGLHKTAIPIWVDLTGSGRCDVILRSYGEGNHNYDNFFIYLHKGNLPIDPRRPNSFFRLVVQTEPCDGEVGTGFVPVYSKKFRRVYLVTDLDQGDFDYYPISGRPEKKPYAGDVIYWDNKAGGFKTLSAHSPKDSQDKRYPRVFSGSGGAFATFVWENPSPYP